jgi:molybdenum cofactor biosynthesis protein B
LDPVPSGSRALVLTISDGVAASTRQDESGIALADRLAHAGFRVDRVAVADDRVLIEQALRSGASDHQLIVSTGGTGLTPRDVTPQATLAVIDYEVPGLAEAIRAAGRAKTALADLSRGVVGVIGRSLVVNVPGSPRAALESLGAIEPTLGHALETLAGPFDHDEQRAAGSASAAGTASAAAAALATPPGPAAEPDRRGTSADLVGDPPPPDVNDEWRDLPEAGRHGGESQQ